MAVCQNIDSDMHRNTESCPWPYWHKVRASLEGCCVLTGLRKQRLFLTFIFGLFLTVCEVLKYYVMEPTQAPRLNRGHIFSCGRHVLYMQEWQ